MSKIIVSIPDEFLKIINKTAKEEHRTRSELFREALRLFLRERAMKGFVSLRHNPTVQQALKIQNKSREEFSDLKFDSSKVIRHFRGNI